MRFIKTLLYSVISVVLLAGGGTIGYFIFKNNSSELVDDKVHINNIHTDCKDKVVSIGEIYTINAITEPYISDCEFLFEVENSDIASVEANGKVEALHVGQTIITISVKGEDSIKKQFNFIVVDSNEDIPNVNDDGSNDEHETPGGDELDEHETAPGDKTEENDDHDPHLGNENTENENNNNEDVHSDEESNSNDNNPSENDKIDDDTHGDNESEVEDNPNENKENEEINSENTDPNDNNNNNPVEEEPGLLGGIVRPPRSGDDKPKEENEGDGQVQDELSYLEITIINSRFSPVKYEAKEDGKIVITMNQSDFATLFTNEQFEWRANADVISALTITRHEGSFELKLDKLGEHTVELYNVENGKLFTLICIIQ